MSPVDGKILIKYNFEFYHSTPITSNNNWMVKDADLFFSEKDKKNKLKRK
jgi:hypothetical protein